MRRPTPDGSAEDLYENAPCGLLSARPDGTILAANRTLLAWTGFEAEEIVGAKRLPELLAVGDRIYYETHVAPLLDAEGEVSEVAVELERPDSSRLPALLNGVLSRDEAGRPQLIRYALFPAAGRRIYERELIDRRRREHEIARELQRSLLDGALPSAQGLEVGVAYRPAVSDLEVGGDWHDAFWLEPDRTAMLVVGDVVGHGIGAAAAMGQLRSALRSLAPMFSGPAGLLGALDAYVERHDVGDMATVVCALARTDSPELTFACAGHVPPLFVSPDGTAGFEWAGRSQPLGAAVGTRSEQTVRVQPGAIAVLYSDGLIERPGRRPLKVGLEQLKDFALAERRRAAPDLAEAFVSRMADADHRDDACVLVARL